MSTQPERSAPPDGLTPAGREDPRAPPRPRWKLAAAILLAGIGLITCLQFVFAHDNAVRSLASVSALGLTLAVLACWFVFLSGLSRSTRRRGLAACVLMVGALIATFRVSGVSGDLVFHIVWRWHDKPDGSRPFDLPAAARWLVTHAPLACFALAPLAWLGGFLIFSRRRRPVGIAIGIGGLALAVGGNLLARSAWGPAEAPRADRALRAPRVDLSRTTAHDYPQFLGPDRNAIVRDVELARDWQASPPKELWRRPVGPGWSSFAVANGYAITQEQRDQYEYVVCYELATGRVVWAHSDRARFDNPIPFGGVGPRATPTIAAGRVYTVGGMGLLNCLDGATGNPCWPAKDLVREHHGNHLDWGRSGSPLVVDNRVVVSAGGKDEHSLVAYDTRTGKLVWRAGGDAASYSSPMICTLLGRRQILIVNQRSLVAHDPKSGKVLWTYDWPGGDPKVPQPIALSNDQVLIAAGYGVGSMLLSIAPSSSGQATATHVWDAFNRQLKPKFTNLVVKEGHVYGLDDGQTLVCLELSSGQVRWKKRAGYGHGQVLLVRNLLIVQAESGDVAIVDPNPESFQELGRLPALKDMTWNNPALSGRHLLVRNAVEAACFELPVRDPAIAAKNEPPL